MHHVTLLILFNPKANADVTPAEYEHFSFQITENQTMYHLTFAKKLNYIVNFTHFNLYF